MKLWTVPRVRFTLSEWLTLFVKVAIFALLLYSALTRPFPLKGLAGLSLGIFVIVAIAVAKAGWPTTAFSATIAEHHSRMLDLDRWAQWLLEQAERLSDDNVRCTLKDGRAAPELALNPSMTVEVDAGARLGRISFWRTGDCDLDVLGAVTGTWIDNAAMLAADDATMPALFRRFEDALFLK